MNSRPYYTVLNVTFKCKRIQFIGSNFDRSLCNTGALNVHQKRPVNTTHATYTFEIYTCLYITKQDRKQIVYVGYLI